jgi:uncharacterized membrane protein YfcA
MMPAALDALLAVAFFLVAVLFSSVGHAGASGYLAIMGLLSIAPAVMRPTALALNVLVAGIGTLRFARAGLFRWRDFWPFAATSIPAAFFGGTLALPYAVYKALVAAVLAIGGLQLILRAHAGATAEAGREAPGVPVGRGLACGVLIGTLAGLTGTGGGIFLTPILLFLGWVATRNAAAVTAPFVLANSLAGLAGAHLALGNLPDALPLWLAAVGLGALLGTWLGIRRYSVEALRRALGVVLLVAAAKMGLG